MYGRRARQDALDLWFSMLGEMLPRLTCDSVFVAAPDSRSYPQWFLVG